MCLTFNFRCYCEFSYKNLEGMKKKRIYEFILSFVERQEDRDNYREKKANKKTPRQKREILKTIQFYTH